MPIISTKITRVIGGGHHQSDPLGLVQAQRHLLAVEHARVLVDDEHGPVPLGGGLHRPVGERPGGGVGFGLNGVAGGQGEVGLLNKGVVVKVLRKK